MKNKNDIINELNSNLQRLCKTQASTVQLIHYRETIGLERPQQYIHEHLSWFMNERRTVLGQLDIIRAQCDEIQQLLNMDCLHASSQNDELGNRTRTS